MADLDFQVKNGLVISNTITINSTGIYVSGNPTVNTTTYIGTSNNSTNLGGDPASNYLKISDSKTLTGNIVFSGANIQVTGANMNVKAISVNNNPVYHTGNLNPANIEANALATAIALAISLG